MGVLKQLGCIGKENRNGLVMYADDQFINQQSLEMNFKDLGLEKNLTIFSNG